MVLSKKLSILELRNILWYFDYTVEPTDGGPLVFDSEGDIVADKLETLHDILKHTSKVAREQGVQDGLRKIRKALGIIE